MNEEYNIIHFIRLFYRNICIFLNLYIFPMTIFEIKVVKKYW